MTRLLICACFLLPVVLAGCWGDDDDSGDPPDLASAWPHADGSEWTYSYDARLYDTSDDPPGAGLPSMEALYRRLREPVSGTVMGDTSVVFVLGLDGQVTTESGVTAQQVTEDFLPRDMRSKRSGAPSVDARTERLLRLAAASRPWLWETIAERFGPAAVDKDFEGMNSPTFLGGYAFAYEDSGYYGYGDLYRDHSWVYLEGPLRAGREFSLQLLTGLADDIWLHGRIWSVGTRWIAGQRYAKIVECLYVVDLGEQSMVDEEGEPAGTMRSFIYGTVWYAPEIGPVGCRERSQALVRTAYDPEGTGQIITWENECHLEGYALPDPE